MHPLHCIYHTNLCGAVTTKLLSFSCAQVFRRLAMGTLVEDCGCCLLADRAGRSRDTGQGITLYLSLTISFEKKGPVPLQEIVEV